MSGLTMRCSERRRAVAVAIESIRFRGILFGRKVSAL
jgi:hypothetical protein